MNKKTVTSAFFLLITLAIVFYLDSPYSFVNIDNSYTAEQTQQAEPVDVQPTEEEPEVIKKLVNHEKVDGFIVETYQEIEVYKDENGKVVKEVPTSRTEILKYYDY